MRLKAMSHSDSEEALSLVVKKLSKLIFVNEKGEEFLPTKMQIEQMLALCKKRNKPSYYKLRHASGMSDAYTFKNIDMYSDDGKKMRRL